LVFLCIYSIFKTYTFYIHDFANYYFGAYAIIHNFFNAEVYNALLFNKKLKAQGFDFLFVSYYPNTPFLSFFYLPFGLVKWKLAKIIFAVLSSILFVYSSLRLKKHFKLYNLFLILIPLLFFTPIKNNILFGQPYLILFFLLSEGFLLYKAQKKVFASLLWAIAILLKVFPILLVFFLFFKKDFKSIFYLSSICCVLLLLSLPFCGIESWQHFIFNVFPNSSAGIIYDAFTVKAKSIHMLFKNLFLFDALLNPNPSINNAFLFEIFSFLFKVSLLSISALASIHYKKKLLVPFSLWLISSLLIGPTFSSYSKILLLFPFVLLSIEFQKNKNYWAIVMAILVAGVCNLPSYWFYKLPLILVFTKALLLVLFFILFVFMYPVKKQLYPILLFSILFGLSFGRSFFNNEENPSYLTSSIDLPILINSYGTEKNKLFYTYWKRGKEIKVLTELKVELSDSKDLALHNNQVYYKGKQKTFSPSNKLYPKLNALNEIVYLSDLNRGEGFYTLRKVSAHD